MCSEYCTTYYPQSRCSFTDDWMYIKRRRETSLKACLLLDSSPDISYPGFTLKSSMRNRAKDAFKGQRFVFLKKTMDFKTAGERRETNFTYFQEVLTSFSTAFPSLPPQRQPSEGVEAASGPGGSEEGNKQERGGTAGPPRQRRRRVVHPKSHAMCKWLNDSQINVLPTTLGTITNKQTEIVL